MLPGGTIEDLGPIMLGVSHTPTETMFLVMPGPTQIHKKESLPPKRTGEPEPAGGKRLAQGPQQETGILSPILVPASLGPPLHSLAFIAP